MDVCQNVTYHMATARLRKAFHYPADNSDDDDIPKDLDEEGMLDFLFVGNYFLLILWRTEQEKLIAKLRNDNEKGNKQFKV